MSTRMTFPLLMLAMTLASPAVAGDAEGKALYEAKCKGCHSIGGEGGKLKDQGGPLDGVAGRRDREWLTAYVTDPKSKIPETKMKAKLNLSEADVANAVDFLLTLR